VALDLFGNLFIADGLSRDAGDPGGHRIRRVDVVTGIITTLAGTGVAGFGGDGGPANLAMLNTPTGVTVDGAGNLYIADGGNARVRKVQSIPPITFSATALAFGQQLVNTSGGLQTLTLTNTGMGSDLTISNIAISGDFTESGSTCGTTLSQNQSCGIGIAFQPSAEGVRYGSLTITDSAPGTAQVFGLFGLGTTDFILSLKDGSSGSATVVAGQAAQYTLTLTPLAFKGAVTLTCAGAPAKTTCAVSPSSATLDGTSVLDIGVAVNTEARSSAAMPVDDGRGIQEAQAGWVLLCALPILPGIVFPRHMLRRSAFIACVMIMLCLAGCGGGEAEGSGTGSGTTAGTYTIAITASAGALSHRVNLTLTVK